MEVDKVFKGATRPPMKFGIPLMPLMGVLIPGTIATAWAFYLVGMWLGFPLVAAQVIVLIYMRETTKKDDQRLSQWLKRVQNFAYMNNKQWGGKMTASPTKRRL
jgi:type IV secretion system protein VirB3